MNTTRAATLASAAPVPTQVAAVIRLDVLRTDPAWTRRYFAGDAEAEYDFLVWQINHGDAPYACPMPVEQTAADMREFAKLGIEIQNTPA